MVIGEELTVDVPDRAQCLLVAELVFFTGPMDCGKSTLALQVHHTQSTAGRAGQLFTKFDRSGDSVISSRLGLSSPAAEVGDELDFFGYAVTELTAGRRLDYLICDEAQFYTDLQVEQLARVVDDLQLDVFAFGILTDFRTRLFPGSGRLVELADRMETLQVQPVCWCGQRATHNARVIDGVMVTEGSQLVVGDTDAVEQAPTEPAEDPLPEADGTVPGMPSETAQPTDPGTVTYEVLCRQHHRRRMTRAVAQATLSPEPLPFGQDPPRID
ncbi:thymidine kinase [Naumannella halotolerans]|uniref:Thymidine kinase n=1 Tax=Naumannella halotolerans TaxID=993414 RepID=A0A4R7J8U1_9ACTN|nr:thymidine kinase [Naumannella halotolerans]